MSEQIDLPLPFCMHFIQFNLKSALISQQDFPVITANNQDGSQAQRLCQHWYYLS